MSEANAKPTWSEELCMQYACRNLIDPAIKNANVQSNVIARFVDFYCNGRVPGHSAKRVVLDAVYLLSDMDNRDALYWRKEFYSKDHTGISDIEDTEAHAAMGVHNDISGYASYASSSSDAGRFGGIIGIKTYMDNTLNRSMNRFSFKAASTNILNQVTSNVQFHELKRLVWYLAVTFLCDVVDCDLTRIFNNHTYHRDTSAHNWLAHVNRNQFLNVSPCSEAIDAVDFKEDDEVKSALAKIVLEYDRATKGNCELSSALNASLLKYIYNYGLEIFEILDQFIKHYEISYQQLDLAIAKLPFENSILEIQKTNSALETCVMSLVASWGTIVQYFEKYCSDKEWTCFPNITFHWAAIIDKNAFVDYDICEHAILGQVLEECLGYTRETRGIFKRVAMLNESEKRILSKVLIKELGITIETRHKQWAWMT